MPSEEKIVCSKELGTKDNLVCETDSESVSQSATTLNVADVKRFKAEILDLCHRVLREDNTPDHQALMFKNMVKSIVHESLTTIVFPNDSSKIDN